MKETVETVRVGANTSYKYITYDPLGRETDGICSRRYKVHIFFLVSSFQWYSVYFDIWQFYLEAFKASSGFQQFRAMLTV